MNTKYENYQLKWMIDHGYSLKDIYELFKKMVADTIDTDDSIEEPFQLYNEFDGIIDDLLEQGFDGEIWVSESEFNNNEKVEYAEPIIEDFLIDVNSEIIESYDKKKQMHFINFEFELVGDINRFLDEKFKKGPYNFDSHEYVLTVYVNYYGNSSITSEIHIKEIETKNSVEILEWELCPEDVWRLKTFLNNICEQRENMTCQQVFNELVNDGC